MNKLTMQFHDCHTLSQLIAAIVYYIRLPLSWHIPEKYLYKDSHMETKIISTSHLGKTMLYNSDNQFNDRKIRTVNKIFEIEFLLTVIYLVFSFSIESKFILWLAIRDLINFEPFIRCLKSNNIPYKLTCTLNDNVANVVYKNTQIKFKHYYFLRFT